MPFEIREWDLTTPTGMRLRVCTWGQDDGELPTLILHGFLEQGAAWDLVARRLPGRVVAPDMRGHGLSGHVGAAGFYHFWDYVPDVLALIDHLGGRVDLVGHSMGGTLSILVAGSRPQRVRRLVNVEGLGPRDAEDRDVEQADRFLQAMQRPPRHRPMVDLEEAVGRLQRYNPALPDDLARHLAERTTQRADGGLVWTWDPLHRSRSPTPFRARVLRRFAERVEAPVLYVNGGQSRFRPDDELERLSWLPHARHVALAEGGHMPHHEQPETLARLIRGHLRA